MQDPHSETQKKLGKHRKITEKARKTQKNRDLGGELSARSLGAGKLNFAHELLLLVYFQQFHPILAIVTGPLETKAQCRGTTGRRKDLVRLS